jgi:hypothetical protein
MAIDKVAVLGCGPAGLLAAHAAHERGAEVHIFSLKKRSPIGGAQYIHYPIPGITQDEPDSQVVYVKQGTRAGYATKVYGDPHAPVSWDNYDEGSHPIWNMQRIYDQLWRRYEALVHPRPIDGQTLGGLLDRFRWVFSTIPKHAICLHQQHHAFQQQPVWIDHFQPDAEGVNKFQAANRIIYSGDGSTDWYRSSFLFGWKSYEFAFEPTMHKPFGDRFIKVEKPLYTDCDCWGDHPGLVLLGRYGRWEKTALAHEAFYQTNHHMWEFR